MKLFIIICLIGVAISFPYMEDTNQNWGFVIEDDVPVDDDNYESRPISFDPIKFIPHTQTNDDSSSPGLWNTLFNPATWNKDAIYFRDDDY